MQSDNNTDYGVINPDTGFCAQDDMFSCAPCAGAMLLWFVGIISSREEMARLMGTTRDGTLDSGITFGIRAKLEMCKSKYGAKTWIIGSICTPLSIIQQFPNYPLLLHENLPPKGDFMGGGHAVVIMPELDRGGVILKDPAKKTSDGLVSLESITQYNPHFAIQLVPV